MPKGFSAIGLDNAKNSINVIIEILGKEVHPKMEKYTENDDGTVTDNETGLVWKQEPEPGGHTFAEALALPKDGWRLPTIKELVSLVDHSRFAPAINTEFFPGTPNVYFWTSTPYADLSAISSSWVVDFYNGYANHRYQGNRGCVRLVRENQP
jgi:hypothetical protein